MRSGSFDWRLRTGWTGGTVDPDAHLVIYFGTRAALDAPELYADLRRKFPQARLIGCSTGGQIVREDVEDEGAAAISFTFDTSRVELASAEVTGADRSREAGEALGRSLNKPGLRGVFVLSDGLTVNGSELVAGIAAEVSRDVPINGGLAGDGEAFERTLVGADAPPRSGIVAAIGFYGDAIRIGHGSAAGWDTFGPERIVTRSAGNVLFELDGKPALALYERYLGDEAKLLPASGLLYPLKIFHPRDPNHDVVRTLLAIDRSTGAMTFAGDMPEGWIAQLMHGNLDHLVEGSAEAGRQAAMPVGLRETSAALLVSCVGRRIFLGQRVNEEIEAATAALGVGVRALGFYSYGEIAPHGASGASELHNQTMTVLTLSELVA